MTSNTVYYQPGKMDKDYILLLIPKSSVGLRANLDCDSTTYTLFISEYRSGIFKETFDDIAKKLEEGRS